MQRTLNLFSFSTEGIEIEKIIEADKKQRDLGVFDETLVKWYLGELDSNFYYSDYNNELLQEYLFNKIMK